MRNDMHIQRMKKANALIKSANEKLDHLYYKHLASSGKKKAA